MICGGDAQHRPGASLPFVILSASEGSRSPALEILRKHIPAQ